MFRRGDRRYLQYWCWARASVEKRHPSICCWDCKQALKGTMLWVHTLTQYTTCASSSHYQRLLGTALAGQCLLQRRDCFYPVLFPDPCFCGGFVVVVVFWWAFFLYRELAQIRVRSGRVLNTAVDMSEQCPWSARVLLRGKCSFPLFAIILEARWNKNTKSSYFFKLLMPLC